MSNDKNKKKEKKQLISPALAKTISKVFAAIWAVFKVAAGAAATVLLICIVCGFGKLRGQGGHAE